MNLLAGFAPDTVLPAFAYYRFLSQSLTGQINLPVSMLPRRKQEKNLLTLTTISMGSQSQDFVSSPCMVLGVVQIWHTFLLQGIF